MKISQKDAKLLILLFCVLLLAASYFFGYKKYSELTDELNVKTQLLTTQYETLADSNQNRQEYTDKIQENKDKIAAIVAKYPSEVKNQDELYLSSIIEKKCGVWINNFNFSEPAIVYTPQEMVEEGTTVNTDGASDTTQADPSKDSGAEESKVETNELGFIGYKNTTQLSFQADYDQMKKLIAFINDYEYRKSIGAINLAVDSTTGLLTGTLEYHSYSMVGLEATYTPLTIPSQPTGIKNIFGEIVNNQQQD